MAFDINSSLLDENPVFAVLSVLDFVALTVTQHHVTSSFAVIILFVATRGHLLNVNMGCVKLLARLTSMLVFLKRMGMLLTSGEV